MVNQSKVTEELRRKYKSMENEALIAIALVDSTDYEPEAVELAKVELANRNISIIEQKKKAGGIKRQRNQEQEEIKNKPLSKRKKIFFTILPAWSIWYLIFVPTEWIQRRKDATKAQWVGFALWIGLVFIIILIAR